MYCICCSSVLFCHIIGQRSPIFSVYLCICISMRGALLLWEKAGPYFHEYWIFCHLRQRSRIFSERQYTAAAKICPTLSCRFMVQKWMRPWWWLFWSQRRWWWRWPLKRWMNRRSLSPRVKNRFCANPIRPTPITTFKVKLQKHQLHHPTKNQPATKSEINFHLSPYGGVWSSRGG